MLERGCQLTETFIETFTYIIGIIGIVLTHNTQMYAGWWLRTSISDTVNTIEIANLTLMHVTIFLIRPNFNTIETSLIFDV